MNLSKLIFVGLFLTLPVHALPFNFTPIGTLPTTIISGATLTASYTLSNNTLSTRNNNYVKWLPTHVTQITTGVGTCGTTFNLGAKGSGTASCTLILNITGAVDGYDPNPEKHLMVCFPTGKTCAGPTTPLNVSLQSSNGLALGVGNYSNLAFTQNLPLSYYSTDGGNTWSLSNTLPPAQSTTNDRLIGAACDSTGNTCTTVGYYDNGVQDVSSSFYTLNGGQDWTISATLPPVQGSSDSLNAVSCNNTGLNCAAVGYSQTGGGVDYPISFYSTDGGKDWTVSATPPPTHSANDNLLVGVSCDSNNGQTCTSVGQYNDGTTDLPLSYYSTTGGNSWTVSATLPPAIGGTTENVLRSVSCNSTGLNCAAVGTYVPGSGLTTPISYYTTDGGNTWTISATTPQPVVSGANTYLRSVACGRTGLKCTAVGYSSTLSPIQTPLSYYSTDGGINWTPSITQPPSFGHTDDQQLSSVSCDSTGTNCVVVGEYSILENTPSAYYTTDGGQNWTTAATQPPVPASAGGANLYGAAGSGP